MPFDPAFPNYVEFPKWIAGVLVHSREEEREILAAAEAMALRTAGGNQLPPTLTEASADTEPTPQTVPTEPAPLEPEPARPASSVTPQMCPAPTTSIIAAHTEAVSLEPEPAQPSPGTSASGRPPSSSGERMRRMRERQRGGRRAVLLDLTATQIEGLIVTGCLDPAVQGDVAEIARAVGRLLDHVARSDPAV